MTKIFILGAGGMLGSMLTDYLCKNSDFEITVSSRNLKDKIKLPHKVNYVPFDADNSNGIKSLNLKNFGWVINAIGIIKPYIKDDDSGSIKRAIEINSLLPRYLAEQVKNSGTKIIQIATDCVYSGNKGNYDENYPHDALDVYGKTKSLGEVSAENFYNLRCSIIGPEIKGKLSLLEWFLAAKKNAEITGFKNHFWNGITTLHFAKICKGIIENDLELPSKQHIIPDGTLSKAQMLEKFAQVYKRKDIKIRGKNVTPAVDRTLTTANPQLNTRLWHSAGYKTSPTIQNMIEELAGYIPKNIQ